MDIILVFRKKKNKTTTQKRKIFFWIKIWIGSKKQILSVHIQEINTHSILVKLAYSDYIIVASF